MADPRFTYEDISQVGVTTKKLDELMAFVMSDQTGVWGSIVSGLKLVVVAGYLYARAQVSAAEAEETKQKNQQSDAHGNQDQIDQDNLGSQPKPAV